MSTAQRQAGDELLTYHEAADRLGITVYAIRHAVRMENLSPVVVKNQKRLRASDVDTYPLRKGKHRQRQQTEPQEGMPMIDEATREGIIRLAEHMAADQRHASLEAARDAIAGIFAGNATLLRTLMGDRSVVDPKRSAAS